MDSVMIAKFLMKMLKSFPVSPEIDIDDINEVFRHPIFVNGSKSKRYEIMLKSSENRYNSELNYAWDHYFGIDLRPLLKGRVALDLGCFTGGRGVAWSERYKLNYLAGIDIKQEYIDAATEFSRLKIIRSDFMLSKGESLPFGEETFDVILSFDVFEHVQDIQQTLNECYRVLNTRGRLFVVFPSYFHPTGHHLSLVTKLPFIHYIFSGKALVKAYYSILEDREDEAQWYKRDSPYLRDWEKCNTINGTTLAKFRKFLNKNKWKIVLQSRKPIGSIGRNISKKCIFKLISYFFYPLTFVPFLQEAFLHRITYILEKKVHSKI